MGESVYLSYAPADGEFAVRLAADLEQRGVALWLEPLEERGARQPSTATRQAMQDCATLLVVLTPDALKCKPLLYELAMLRKMGGKRIVVVKVAPCRTLPLLDGETLLDLADQPTAAIAAAVAGRIGGGFSRRALLLGGVGAVGLLAVGGLWWGARHAGGPGAGLALPTPTALPAYLPATLAALGFQGQTFAGVTALIPPLKDVPAGPFKMGSDKTVDKQFNADELPPTTLTLADFQIAAFPLTVAEYALAVLAKAVPAPPDIGTLTWVAQQQRLDHPVVNLTWQNAADYAAWLAKLTGQPWRLPTEAEWEKAARGSDGRIYPWGGAFDPTRANTADRGPQATTAVGTYPTGASPCGAQDMAGNVFEWVSSLYKAYPYKATDGRENPKDLYSDRVLRGGSWFDPSPLARSAYRAVYPGVAVGSASAGVRLARGGPTL